MYIRIRRLIRSPVMIQQTVPMYPASKTEMPMYTKINANRLISLLKSSAEAGGVNPIPAGCEKLPNAFVRFPINTDIRGSAAPDRKRNYSQRKVPAPMDMNVPMICKR